jgi:hypothetical protein
MIDLYHRTTKAAALRILQQGFRDQSGKRPAFGRWKGVWLSDREPEKVRGIRGRALLIVTIDMSMANLAIYELIVDDQPGRVFVLPAEIIELVGRIRRIDAVGCEPSITKSATPR